MRKRMRGLITQKNRRFFRAFFLSASMILAFGSLIAFWGYQTSVKALEQEVNQMNYSAAKELRNRMEESLEQGNRLASLLAIDTRIQLFFTRSEPEAVVDDFYTEVKGKLAVHGIPYIDSVILYAPKYGRIYDSGEEIVKQLPNAAGDLSWLEKVTPVDRTTTTGYVRAKDSGWPYYYSIVKHYRYGSVDSVVVVNINLLKLHSSLLADREESMDLYVVDEARRIIMRDDQMTLFSALDEVPALQQYEPERSFAELHVTGEERDAYAQVYSEKYGFTVVTVTQMGDYLAKLMEIREQFLLILLAVALGAMAVAGVYSIKLFRPIQRIKDLLDNPKQWEPYKHAEDIQEIADQIISHLQTNKLLREELDSRLDLLNRTQIQALQTQINPHFLFNTLNVVSLMLEQKIGEEDAVVQAVGEMSDILRYSLSDSGIVSIKEEVAYAKKYLSILRFRYDEFNSAIDMDESLCDCAIPRLVLQPLIENAVQHGRVASLKDRKGMVTVKINKTLESDDGETLPSVCIEIVDNGLGISEEKLKELREGVQNHDNIPTKHIGVVNVALRFYLNFHNEQQMTIESTLEKGTKIRIVFPLVEWPEEK